MDKNSVLITGVVLYRDDRGKDRFFLIKESEAIGWELPKVVTRKGESSVRAALRLMGEKGGMTTKVLEEAARSNSVATTNGKTVQQRHIYYLMHLKSKGLEAIGFSEDQWLEYPAASKKLSSKKEKTVLKDARDLMKNLKKWKKSKKSKKEED